MRKRTITATVNEWMSLSQSFAMIENAGLPIRFLLVENNNRIRDIVVPVLENIQSILRHNVVLDEKGMFSYKKGFDPERHDPRPADYQFVSDEAEKLALAEVELMGHQEVDIELIQWSLDRPFVVDEKYVPLSSILETNPVTASAENLVNQLMQTVLYFPD